MASTFETSIPEPRKWFIQRTQILLCLLGAIFFLSSTSLRGFSYLIAAMSVLLCYAEPYSFQNTQKSINAILESVPERDEEPANYMTQYLKLIWPHIFSTNRVNQFKENLSSVLKDMSIPMVSTIELLELQLGREAPQIVSAKKLKGVKEAPNSMALEIEAYYYPSLVLKALVKTSTIEPVITFKDLAITLNAVIQLEFKTDPLLPEIPFWTAMSIVLVEPPSISGFNIAVNSMKNVFNGDGLKAYMSKAASTTLWSICGSPNGIVWEKVFGRWGVQQVVGDQGLKRCSLSETETLRISRIKRKATKYVQDHLLAVPQVIVTTSYADVETTTYYLELVSNLDTRQTIQSFDFLMEATSGWSVSPDEFKWVYQITSIFMTHWFDNYIASLKLNNRKSQNLMAEAEKQMGSVYTYLNFLGVQEKDNQEMYKQLEISKYIDKLYEKITTAHQRLASA